MTVTREEQRSCPQCQLPVFQAEDNSEASFCHRCRLPLFLLAGKYRFERVLGQGGFGTVYLARHVGITLRPERVIKVVPPEIFSTPGVAERFRREIQITAALSERNPHIVRVYDDFGELEDLGGFYIMEYLRGVPLSEILRREGALPLPRSLSLFRQLCQAMGPAHREGVIHRDLKPENLLVLQARGEPEHLKVIDFGIARDQDRRVGTSVGNLLIGTPRYMSPEHIRGLPVDARSDIYAMGVILYEILTGSAPFPRPDVERPDARSLLVAHLQEEPEPLQVRRPGFPEALDIAVRRALKKHPEERYASAEALREALAPFAASEAGPRAPEPTRATAQDQLTQLTPASGEPVTQREIPALLRSSPVDTEATSATAGGLWRYPGGQRTNLQLPPTSFIGREDDLAWLLARFASGARLVTILGPGGTGKTRLALQYGDRHLEEYPGGVWFCDLTQARSLAGVLDAVAKALSVPLTGGRTAEDSAAQLGRTLAARGQALFVLDNLEQVVEHTPATLGGWLRSALEARFLVTSRQRLRLAGEVCLDLSPLPEADAQALFLARAQAAQQSFAPREDERAVIAEIARRLDGIPLALELAAARVRVLPPGKLLERLGRRLQTLGGQRDASARQATLRGTLDWSWELLSPPEQEAMAQCAVFLGGFTLEAAEAVLDLPPDGPGPLEALEALQDKSLLRSFEPRGLPGELCFGMYESIHEYARERLEARGESAALFARHQRFYLREGELLAAGASGPGAVACLVRLALVRENLLAVHQRALGHDPEAAARAALALHPLHSLRGPLQDHLRLLDAVAKLSLSPRLRSRVLLARGEVRLPVGLAAEATVDLEEALRLAREVGERPLEGLALRALGDLLRDTGRLREAEEPHRQALACFQEVGDRHQQGLSLRELGATLWYSDRVAEAEACLHQALPLLRGAGDRRAQGRTLFALGALCGQQRRLTESEELSRQALSAAREVGDLSLQGRSTGSQGFTALHRGRLSEVEGFFQQALTFFREAGDYTAQGIWLCNLGNLYQEQNRLAEAEAIYQRSIAILHEVGSVILEGAVSGELGTLYHETGRAEEAEALYQRGREILRARGARRFLGFLSACHAALEADHGDVARAEVSLEEARENLTAVGDPLGRVIVEVHRGHLDLALSREATARRNEVAALTHRQAAEARLKSAQSPGSPTAEYPEGAPPAESLSSEVRRAVRMLRHTLPRTPIS